jgi:hypothetical protein
MRPATNHSELTKVLVQRDKNALLAIRAREDLIVPGILRPTTRPDRVMSVSRQLARCPHPKHRSRAKASRAGVRDPRFDSFMGDELVGIPQASADIVGLQPWIAFEDRLGCITLS